METMIIYCKKMIKSANPQVRPPGQDTTSKGDAQQHHREVRAVGGAEGDHVPLPQAPLLQRRRQRLAQLRQLPGAAPPEGAGRSRHFCRGNPVTCRATTMHGARGIAHLGLRKAGVRTSTKDQKKLRNEILPRI